MIYILMKITNCGYGCPALYYCNENVGKCVHDPLIPPGFMEIFVILTLSFSSLISTSCGVGGILFIYK
jgi:hypothetical protein